MNCYFREDETLVICSENPAEQIALKYWLKNNMIKVIDLQHDQEFMYKSNKLEFNGETK